MRKRTTDVCTYIRDVAEIAGWAELDVLGPIVRGAFVRGVTVCGRIIATPAHG